MMIITDDYYGNFDVSLGDDGTLDTVIIVQPPNGKCEEIRYSTEYGAHFRDDTGAMTDIGFEELAEEAVDAYIEQYLV